MVASRCSSTRTWRPAHRDAQRKRFFLRRTRDLLLAGRAGSVAPSSAPIASSRVCFDMCQRTAGSPRSASRRSRTGSRSGCSPDARPPLPPFPLRPGIVLSGSVARRWRRPGTRGRCGQRCTFPPKIAGPPRPVRTPSRPAPLRPCPFASLSHRCCLPPRWRSPPARVLPRRRRRAPSARRSRSR